MLHHDIFYILVASEEGSSSTSEKAARFWIVQKDEVFYFCLQEIGSTPNKNLKKRRNYFIWGTQTSIQIFKISLLFRCSWGHVSSTKFHRKKSKQISFSLNYSFSLEFVNNLVRCTGYSKSIYGPVMVKKVKENSR